jgi:hypothetical protein
MELRQASWHTALTHQLAHLDRTSSDLKTKPMKQSWKIELAGEIRHKTGASIPWLAEHLHLGGAATLRGYLHQAKRAKK